MVEVWALAVSWNRPNSVMSDLCAWDPTQACNRRSSMNPLDTPIGHPPGGGPGGRTPETPGGPPGGENFRPPPGRPPGPRGPKNGPKNDPKNDPFLDPKIGLSTKDLVFDWGISRALFWAPRGPPPLGGARGGAKKCTFFWVFNNSPSRDSFGTLFRTPPGRGHGGLGPF